MFHFNTTDTTDEEITVLIQLAKLFPGVKKTKVTMSDFVVVVAEVSLEDVHYLVLDLFSPPVAFFKQFFVPWKGNVQTKCNHS